MRKKSFKKTKQDKRHLERNNKTKMEIKTSNECDSLTSWLRLILNGLKSIRKSNL